MTKVDLELALVVALAARDERKREVQLAQQKVNEVRAKINDLLAQEKAALPDRKAIVDRRKKIEARWTEALAMHRAGATYAAINRHFNVTGRARNLISQGRWLERKDGIGGWPERIKNELGRYPRVGDWYEMWKGVVREIYCLGKLRDLGCQFDDDDTGERFWATEAEALAAVSKSGDAPKPKAT